MAPGAMRFETTDPAPAALASRRPAQAWLAATAALALLLAGCASGPGGRTGSDGAEARPPSGLDRVPSAQPREEAIRQELKGLVRHLSHPKEDRLGLRTATEMQEALLVRFARTREAEHFATTLADSLSASRWLAERIMLDISGLQLATTLVSLNLSDTDTALVLTRFYPHLAERIGDTTRAEALLQGLDPAECDVRVEAWRRADSYTFGNSQRGSGDDRAPAAAQNRGAQQLRPDRDLRIFGRR